MNRLYIGLMSGTSIDSLDIAITSINDDTKISLIDACSKPWPSSLQLSLHELCHPSNNEIFKLGKCRKTLTEITAKHILDLLKRNNLKSSDITAIGSHGQTIRHCPHDGFTYQLDDPALLSVLTGIDVIADFRSADVARGGEGAPLTPLFHREILGSSNEIRYILNIGGICNLTVVNTDKTILTGYDTGPGNTLIDLVCRNKLKCDFDKDGVHAKQGYINPSLLSQLLSHPYLSQPSPKSTGRETFNERTISEALNNAHSNLEINSLIATLTAFTVSATTQEITKIHMQLPDSVSQRLILCGGGAYNPVIRSGFASAMEPIGISVSLSSDFNVSEQYLEAEAFAYFAWLFTQRRKINLGPITGSKTPQIMGALYPSIYGWFASTK